eukprot:471442_1
MGDMSMTLRASIRPGRTRVGITFQAQIPDHSEYVFGQRMTESSIFSAPHYSSERIDDFGWPLCTPHDTEWDYDEFVSESRKNIPKIQRVEFKQPIQPLQPPVVNNNLMLISNPTQIFLNSPNAFRTTNTPMVAPRPVRLVPHAIIENQFAPVYRSHVMRSNIHKLSDICDTSVERVPAHIVSLNSPKIQSESGDTPKKSSLKSESENSSATSMRIRSESYTASPQSPKFNTKPLRMTDFMANRKIRPPPIGTSPVAFCSFDQARDPEPHHGLNTPTEALLELRHLKLYQNKAKTRARLASQVVTPVSTSHVRSFALSDTMLHNNAVMRSPVPPSVSPPKDIQFDLDRYQLRRDTKPTKPTRERAHTRVRAPSPTRKRKRRSAVKFLESLHDDQMSLGSSPIVPKRRKRRARPKTNKPVPFRLTRNGEYVAAPPGAPWEVGRMSLYFCNHHSGFFTATVTPAHPNRVRHGCKMLGGKMISLKIDWRNKNCHLPHIGPCVKFVSINPAAVPLIGDTSNFQAP